MQTGAPGGAGAAAISIVCWRFAGLSRGQEASIRKLADRLALRHHSTVELIDRMEAHGFVKRNAGAGKDRRQVLVSLQPRGEKLLEKSSCPTV